MEVLLPILIMVWIVISVIVGTFGQKRQIGFGGAFFASLFLSPILAMLFILASKELTEEELQAQVKETVYEPVVYVPENPRRTKLRRIMLRLTFIILLGLTAVGIFAQPARPWDDGTKLPQISSHHNGVIHFYDGSVKISSFSFEVRNIPELKRLFIIADKMHTYFETNEKVYINKDIGIIGYYTFQYALKYRENKDEWFDCIVITHLDVELSATYLPETNKFITYLTTYRKKAFENMEARIIAEHRVTSKVDKADKALDAFLK